MQVEASMICYSNLDHDALLFVNFEGQSEILDQNVKEKLDNTQ